MSRTAFKYPLPSEALNLFCHPVSRHHLSRPMRMDGEVVAANGYVAIRCQRGAWIDSEFPEAWTDFRSRVERLPWARMAHLKDDWRALDDVRGTLFRRAPIGLWIDDARDAGRLSPSPVVWVAGGILVRLSMLQLIARLPRCEIYTGTMNTDDPLWFRFSGGRGLIARDTKLTSPAAFTVFEPMRDCLTGERVERQKTPKPNFGTPPPPEPALEGWPPPTAED